MPYPPCRDDDNDMSDEERVDFALNSAQRERQHMKDIFLAAEHGSDEEGDSDQERLHWEQQQLQKVVGGASREPQVCSTLLISCFTLLSMNMGNIYRYYNSINICVSKSSIKLWYNNNKYS